MSTRVSHRAILGIALPAMATNVATALFGLADMWVIGQLGDPSAQGGVEVGAKLLMSLLVVFNFLKSSTVALTAQAGGRDDPRAQSQVMLRAIVVALTIGVALLAAAPLVIHFGLGVLGASGSVARQADLYVTIRYGGGLPWLLNAVLTGWLIGRRRVRTVLAVEVGANLIHVALDLSLVLGAGLGVAGVAMATLASETAKCLALAIAAGVDTPQRGTLGLLRDRSTWSAAALVGLFRLNRDLFLRTLLLMTATVLLTRAGALQGAVILAANAIIYQFFIVSALLLDGFESAAQVLCGEALGAGRRGVFARTVWFVLAWAGAFAVAITVIYAVAGAPLSQGFSAAPAVVQTVKAYLGWAVFMPVAGFASYVFDGVFIGANWTRAMLFTMAIALAGFALSLVLTKALGDGGLWLAFSLFLALRGAGQAVLAPSLARRSFSPAEAV